MRAGTISLSIFPLVCIVWAFFYNFGNFTTNRGEMQGFFDVFWKDMGMILRCAFLFDYFALIDYY